MTIYRGERATIVVALACWLWLTTLRVAPALTREQASVGNSVTAIDANTISAAICPIVYQADRSPSARGYRYLFYGNGFFINEEGYVITAAHVLSQLHGGQPYLLIRAPSGTPAFVPASVGAIDHDHDVALLLAAPNPFQGAYTVSFLPFTAKVPMPGSKVLAAAVRPSNPRDSYTLEPTVEERSAGDVLNFEFTQLERGRADTELFLFGHSIQPGQSGAPVISLDSNAVVGLVEGEWLRNASALSLPTEHPTGSSASTAVIQTAFIPGAVIPIHYAIALLQQKSVEWHVSSQRSLSGEPTPSDGEVHSLPVPLSLIPAPYPSQSLFGGELLLDVLVSPSGNISNIRVVRGDQPFLQKGLAAVRTWTFVPARIAGQAIESHVAVVFVFPQPYVPPRSSTIHHYDDALSVAAHDRAALPLTTAEPEYPAGSNAEGSVIVYGTVTIDGGLASLKTLRDFQPLTQATVAAMHAWHFAPSKRAGADIESVAVVVSTFRRPLVANQLTQ